MLPDLNKLKVFYYIYLKQSVAAAAQVLHVTQSAVSQNLIKLEEELKLSLFTRLHKRLIPTTAAEKLFLVLKPFIKDLETAIAGIHYAKKVPSGELKIGAPVEFGENFVIDACSLFHKQYPEVDFHLELGHPDKLLPLLKNGTLDLAFADIFTQKGEYRKELALFSIEPIFDETLVLACSAQFFQQKMKEDQTLKALKQCFFIGYQRHSPSIKAWFKHHFNKELSSVRTVFTVESVRGVIGCLKRDLGLGIVPQHLVQTELETGELVLIKGSSEELNNRISLVRLLDRVPNLTEKLFLNGFVKTIQKSKP